MNFFSYATTNPEYIESRLDDPHVPTPPPPSLAPSVLATTHLERDKDTKTKLKQQVATNQGLVDVDLTQKAKIDTKTILIRAPGGQNIPKLTVHQDVIRTVNHGPKFPITNLDDENALANRHVTQTKAKQLYNDSEKRNAFADYYYSDNDSNDFEPYEYDEKTYKGPFGLKRTATFIYFIVMSIIALLAASLLIMTGVFYSQNYPDSSSNTNVLIGIGVCAFVFYLSLQLILIAIWHQKYRQEDHVNKCAVHNDSTDHLHSYMENSNAYNYSMQYENGHTQHEYYSNPPYNSYATQPVVYQHAGQLYYDPSTWPSNFDIESQSAAKYIEPTEQHETTEISPKQTLTSRSFYQKNYEIKKTTKRPLTESFGYEAANFEFDNLGFNENNTKEKLPILKKAPETEDLIRTIAQVEHEKSKSSKKTESTTKMSTLNDSVDDKTKVTASNDDGNQDENDENGERHHHNHRHRHHHRHHHGHHHRSHHSHHRHHHSNHRHHHHHHHHHRSHRSQSPCALCEMYLDDHHHPPAVSYPRTLEPSLPKIITPTPIKVQNTPMVREVAINTSGETKIMRDEGVTANLEDIPDVSSKRLDQIPVVRRTIIVEPYPAQPSSQIVVKPRGEMIGKIRLGKGTSLNDGNETIIYPSTAFMTKKSKKKKSHTNVNNMKIETLRLDDLDYDYQGRKPTKNTMKTTKIKNAFYN